MNSFPEYDEQLSKCRDVFVKKTQDYGTNWRVMRTSSMIDQILIKAQRIRSIEEKGEQRVDDSIESEYLGIVNYSILALIQLELGESMNDEIEYGSLFALYDKHAGEARSLMEKKNHD